MYACPFSMIASGSVLGNMKKREVGLPVFAVPPKVARSANTALQQTNSARNVQPKLASPRRMGAVNPHFASTASCVNSGGVVPVVRVLGQKGRYRYTYQLEASKPLPKNIPAALKKHRNRSGNRAT